MDQMEKYNLYDPRLMSLHCTPGQVTLPDGSEPTGDVFGCRHIWFRTMAQMFSSVSPAMHDEFDVQYSLPLAERCAYDEEGVLAGGGRANAYELLRDGRGICQAYALAFMALCRGAGLEADFVCSPDMDHAWNHVRVDGMWYHVDVTHDDPVPSAEEEGAVYHHRWLRSDAGMDTLGYHGYTCAQEHTCADTRYEQGGAGALSSFSAPVRYTPVGWAVESLDRLPALFSVTGNPSAGVIRHAAGDLDGDGQVGVADLVLCRQFFGDREVWADALRRSILNG
jgi:hypothetical protein